MPPAARWCRYAAIVQRYGNCARTLNPRRHNLTYHIRHGIRPLRCQLSPVQCTLASRLPSIGDKPRRSIRVAQPLPSGFSSLQCSLRPLADHLTFVFGNGSEQMQSETVGMRHVTREEVYAAIHQVRYKCDIARQPVQLGDHEGSTVQLACGQRGGKLWSVCFPAGFNLDIFRNQRVTAAGNVRCHCCPLCLQAKP